MQTPAISVVIPTFNRPEFIGRVLQGVVAQDYQDWECLVVDDGSRPDVVARLREIIAAADPRVRLLEKPPEMRSTGAAASRNRGMAAARGEFLAFCDDDDHWFTPDHLSVALMALREQGGELYFANMRSGNGERLARADWYGRGRPWLTGHRLEAEKPLYRLSRRDMAQIIPRCVMSPDTLVVTRALATRVGGYWERLAISEDINLMFRLADNAQGIIFRDEICAHADTAPRPSLIRSAQTVDSPTLAIMASVHIQYALRDRDLRRAARKIEAWALFELAEAAAKEGRLAAARELCLKSLRLERTRAALRLLPRLLFRRDQNTTPTSNNPRS